ncbi:MAG: hypothetical protein EHM72_16120, partial [Calditrichaeota bacterium]
PGESKSVEFTLTPKNLMVIDGDGNLVMESGPIEIAIGGGLPGFIPATSGCSGTTVQVKAN